MCTVKVNALFHILSSSYNVTSKKNTPLIIPSTHDIIYGTKSFIHNEKEKTWEVEIKQSILCPVPPNTSPRPLYHDFRLKPKDNVTNLEWQQNPALIT